jgi:pimeloyl-ACP methyl ester carboxylesterase
MTDHDLAVLCKTFAGHAAGYSVRRYEAETVVALRGSTTVRDWVQDMLVLEIEHPVLGRVHEGFLAEAAGMASGIAQDCAGRPFTLCGHSRGGAIALVLGALLKGSGCVASAIVTFGAPRAGGPRLADALWPIPIRQYRCGGDPIPFWPEPPFANIGPLIEVGQPQLNPIADHYASRYAEEVRDGH